MGVTDLSWLAPLGDYGGPTQTHALLSGSPAIDAGDDDRGERPRWGRKHQDQLTTDQRGQRFARIFGEP